MSIKRKTPKPKPKPVIEYPPVPTKKWIPPDKRPKPPKPKPKYEKPEGVSQKLAISTLKRVWHLYEVVGDNKDSILTGHFAQTHKRFSFKTNGLQGPSNCAVACAFAYLYKMSKWTKYYLDNILVIGDALYVRSTQQGDRCWIEIPPEKVFGYFFLGDSKIALGIDDVPRLTDILTSVTEAKAKVIIVNALEKFFEKQVSGMYNIGDKYVAIWMQDKCYFMFDPTEHDDTGIRWTGKPGDGVSLLVRSKSIPALADWLYRSFEINAPNLPFHIIQSGVSRTIKIDIRPPETFEEILPATGTNIAETDEAEPEIPPKDPRELLMEEYISKPLEEIEPIAIQLEEVSPLAGEGLSPSRCPSWIDPEEKIEKNDACSYPIPTRPMLDNVTYYNELISKKMGILRANTCQTDEKFTKYAGRQSLANALSAIAMLRVTKSKLWIPRIVNTILKYGDIIFNDVMKTIPRTRSLKLTDFQRPIDYENKKLEPKVEEYAAVGKLQSQDPEILDLLPALEDFLVDNDCCIIRGPLVLAVWAEDSVYYMFDPNERDKNGKVVVKNAIISSNVVNLEATPGVACVTWYHDLKDMVAVYMENTEKVKRSDRFFLSKVEVNDFVEKPLVWNKFQGVCLGKWILRGSFSQDSYRFCDTNRGFQAPANCLVAIAMQTLKPVQDWSGDTVDKILMIGDEFYGDSIAFLTEKGAVINRMLLLSELKNAFVFENKRAQCEIEECVVNGLIDPEKQYLKDVKKMIMVDEPNIDGDDEKKKDVVNEKKKEVDEKKKDEVVEKKGQISIELKKIDIKDYENLPNIKKGLEIFFKDNDFGIFTIRHISFAIWRKNGAYFCFDPYGRDENGVAIGFGTSCALRFLDLADLASHIETNLDPNIEDLFNINKITIILMDVTDSGVVATPLNNFTKLTNNSAILRSFFSEKADKYGINVGLQTIPMCLSAIGFNKLKPSTVWNKYDLDNILDKGDKIYLDSMIKAKDDLAHGMEPPPPPSPPLTEVQTDSKVVSKPASVIAKTADTNVLHDPPQVDVKPSSTPSEKESVFIVVASKEIPITSENVLKEFRVGPNSFVLDFEPISEGSIKDSLQESIQTHFQQQISDENDANLEALLETNSYKVAIWRDDNVFYAFDSKPRDSKGQVIGKEEWPPEPPPPPPVQEPPPEKEGDEGTKTVEGEEEEEGETKEDEQEEAVTELDKDPKEKKVEVEEKVDEEPKDEDNEDNEDEEKKEGDDEEKEDEDKEDKEAPKPPAPLPKPTKSPEYWLEQEKEYGRACTVWFSNIADLAAYIYNNIPTKERLQGTFTLKAIKVVNHLLLKDKWNPEDERPDVYAGDWYEFVEIEHGKWILKGTLNLLNEMFPDNNRGKQQVTASVVALACVYAFGMPCFHKVCVDSLVIYGDKLYTFIKRLRKKQLLGDTKSKLKTDEVDWLVSHEEVTVKDIVKKICIFRFMVAVDIEENVVVGDLKAEELEDLLDLKRGLKSFFEDNRYGLLTAKGLTVAIWRGEKICFMFDGMNRGSNGLISPIGTAVLSRYLDSDKLAEVFMANLPAIGNNTFCIHKVKLVRDMCPRSREPPRTLPKSVTASAGFKTVMPGKNIVRGSISQEDPKFGKGPNAMSAPIAVIALTMSLIHKPETWSRPIIDEVVYIGAELFDDSAEMLGFDFNPWEKNMDIYSVINDYSIGVLKANCEFRHMDQKGLIDTLEPDKNNIRQGLEYFFQENTHGIIVSEPLTVAIWEEESDDKETLIYMFDPNPRSQTGMPVFTGTACLLSFVNSEMAANHFMGCILDPEKRKCEFRIVPVEIVVGNLCTKKKLRRIPTRSSILPRCSKLVASEKKKKLRKIAEEERKRKEARRLQAIGRNGYSAIKTSNEALIRGYKSQSSTDYSEESRGNQDIPNCIVALVMHTLIPIDSWTYKHVDIVLDTGDQLYIDSYIAYSPQDKKLGMENIVRKFFLKNLEVHVTVFKPIVSSLFTVRSVEMTLSSYFQQEQFCILNYTDLWVAMVFKSGYFYLFDPHERDIEGNPAKDPENATAVVLRFESLDSLALKVVHNLGDDDEESVKMFSLWLIAVVSKTN